METLSLFDVCKEPLKIDKPIRLIELFAGIGSQAKALKRLGANFVHYRACEFDKYAIASYNAIHGTNFETSDIREISAKDLGIVDTDKYCYIMTYSFPCQDLSLAGKGQGMAKGSNTRSGLLWEVERLLDECNELPQILLMENVTQVHGKKNKEHFDEWIAFLERKGYSNYWQDLNAKNFGIPQNRNRTFMVSVLGEYSYEFPQEFPLKLRLKDMLEDSVDEKFYLSGKMINYLHTITEKNRERNNNNVYSPADVDGVSKCVTTKEGSRVKDNFIEEPNTRLVDVVDPFVVASRGRNPENPSDRTAGIPLEQRLEANFSGCSNTLTTVQKDNYVCEPTMKKVGNIYPSAAQNGNVYSSSGIAPTIASGTTDTRGNGGVGSCNSPKIVVMGNYSPSGHDASRIVEPDGLAPTVKENHGTVTAVAEPVIIQKYGDRGTNQYSVRNYAHTIPANPMSDRVQMVVEQPANEQYNLRIRKLTPKECWRLMGFDDEDFEKASAVNSNTQLYKQAGNSIVVDVLCYIFGEML